MPNIHIKFWLFLLLELCMSWTVVKCVATDDPCLTTNRLNDWRRSVNYNSSYSLCDSKLATGWYRVSSCAGQMMPTSCPFDGKVCGTHWPIWLSSRKIEKGGSFYPRKDQTVNRTACVSTYDGNCCRFELKIQIRNCGNYFVYYLVPPPACNYGYCFGDKVPSNLPFNASSEDIDGCKSNNAYGPQLFQHAEVHKSHPQISDIDSPLNLRQDPVLHYFAEPPKEMTQEDKLTFTRNEKDTEKNRITAKDVQEILHEYLTKELALQAKKEKLIDLQIKLFEKHLQLKYPSTAPSTDLWGSM